ncbi:nascent polypeptide-associated complex subunit alpha, muscle-specific form-like [Artibeus jamaicensis]|uniref:nascent polypeptide-associated complex subunit alpha, muscle-specific form-like n=1 Tax=Artibeus jamaicensis TaxID=9417 RepID=UPI00235A5677|nr:nascent polypeptide-associated complex subunit alpha, muscle-specific form-like [Artibeus jamaicensis]
MAYDELNTPLLLLLELVEESAELPDGVPLPEVFTQRTTTLAGPSHFFSDSKSEHGASPPHSPKRGDTRWDPNLVFQHPISESEASVGGHRSLARARLPRPPTLASDSPAHPRPRFALLAGLARSLRETPSSPRRAIPPATPTSHSAQLDPSAVTSVPDEPGAPVPVTWASPRTPSTVGCVPSSPLASPRGVTVAAPHLGVHHLVIGGRGVETTPAPSAPAAGRSAAAVTPAVAPRAPARPGAGAAAVHRLVAAVVEARPLVGEQRHCLVDVVLGQAQGLADGGGVREAHAQQRGHVLLLLRLHGFGLGAAPAGGRRSCESPAWQAARGCLGAVPALRRAPELLACALRSRWPRRVRAWAPGAQARRRPGPALRAAMLASASSSAAATAFSASRRGTAPPLPEATGAATRLPLAHGCRSEIFFFPLKGGAAPESVSTVEGTPRGPSGGEGGPSVVAAAARPFLLQQVPSGAGGAGAQCTARQGASPKSPSCGPSVALPAVPCLASEPSESSRTARTGLVRPCKIRNAAQPACNPLAEPAFHLQPHLKCTRSRRKFTLFPRKFTCHAVRSTPECRHNSSLDEAHRPTRAEN